MSNHLITMHYENTHQLLRRQAVHAQGYISNRWEMSDWEEQKASWPVVTILAAILILYTGVYYSVNGLLSLVAGKEIAENLM